MNTEETRNLSVRQIAKVRALLKCEEGRGGRYPKHYLSTTYTEKVKLACDLMNSLGAAEGDWEQLLGKAPPGIRIEFSDHLTDLGGSCARALVKLCRWSSEGVNLKSVETLDLVAAEAMAGYEGQVSLRGLRAISDEVAYIFSNCKGTISLMSLEAASPQAWRILYRSYGDKIELPCPDQLDPVSAEALVQSTCPDLILWNIKFLDKETAKVLAGSASILRFSNIRNLEPEVASELANHGNYLHLNGLENLPMESATALARHRFPVFLPGLKQPSDPMWEIFAGHPSMFFFGTLVKRRLLEIDASMSKHQLARLRKAINSGRKEILQEVCDELSANQATRGDWYSVFTQKSLKALKVDYYWEYHLPKLTSLHPHLAECLAFSGVCSFEFGGLTALDCESATWLVSPYGQYSRHAKIRAKLILQNLTDVSERLSKILFTVDGLLVCPGMEQAVEAEKKALSTDR